MSFDSLKEAATGLVDKISKLLPSTVAGADPIYTELGVNPDLEIWKVDGSAWHQVYAYQFIVQVDDNKEKIIYTLPIPPQSLVTRMIPASQVTPTIGGMVEETSTNVLWMINMQGTTGIGVSRGDGGRAKMASQFRDKITTTGMLSGALAGVNQIIGKVAGVADKLMESFSKDPAEIAKGLVGAVNTALLPPLPYSGSGVNQNSNGFSEMQEFHRFLYTYSKLKEKNPSKYKLLFRNYKTNQEWQVMLQDFQIQKSAQSPMLERYTIGLKCWNLKGIDNKGMAVDRFGPNGDLSAVSTIAPKQMQKLFANITHKGNSVNRLLR
jgi:hypothetical protein